MGSVLVLTRRDGTTTETHITSPYLAVMFERVFDREPSGVADAAWMAFLEAHDRAPDPDNDELLIWLKDFVDSEIVEQDPTQAAPVESPASSPT